MSNISKKRKLDPNISKNEIETFDNQHPAGPNYTVDAQNNNTRKQRRKKNALPAPKRGGAEWGGDRGESLAETVAGIKRADRLKLWRQAMEESQGKGTTRMPVPFGPLR